MISVYRFSAAFVKPARLHFARERGVLSEYPAARARASYWFDKRSVSFELRAGRGSGISYHRDNLSKSTFLSDRFLLLNRSTGFVVLTCLTLWPISKKLKFFPGARGAAAAQPRCHASRGGRPGGLPLRGSRA